MRIEEHCKSCLKKFGKDYWHVHRWLDEYASKFNVDGMGMWMGHRIVRHHDEGIEEVRVMWGDEAAEAAKLHIMEDEGCIPTRLELELRYGNGPLQINKK